jgi:hypothetical protein
VGRTKQTITLQVTPVPSGCAETAPWEVSSNASWIQVGKVDRNSRPATVTLTIQANNGGRERRGILEIAGKKVSVTQNAKNH